MKILITGGSGFIGRNLKEELSGEYKIFSPSHEELDLLDSIEVEIFLKKNKFDIVLHTATWNATSTSMVDRTMVLENNLRMFFNIEKCSSFCGKIINFGSGAEYSREHWQPLMKEEYFGSHIPSDDYGFSKYLISKHIEKSANIINLRLFGVFGKYEDFLIRFISYSCIRALDKLPITIKQNVNFDYLYINDLVRIVKWFIENESGNKCYNICTGITHELETLAQKVIAASGEQIEINISKEGMGREYSGNNYRLLNQIQDFEFSVMDDSIKELFKWYKENKL